jgi:hypothetical protein
MIFIIVWLLCGFIGLMLGARWKWTPPSEGTAWFAVAMGGITLAMVLIVEIMEHCDKIKFTPLSSLYEEIQKKNESN